jgi:hypothetical protein
MGAGTKINEDETQAMYFSHRLRSPEAHLTLNWRNIPFVNHAKYLGVIFDKRSANIKLTLHKALIRSVMTYARLAWELAADTS